MAQEAPCVNDGIPISEIIIELRASRHWVDDNGIIISEIRPNAEYCIEDALADIEVTKRLSGYKPIPALVDIRELNKVNKEARQVFSSGLASETFKAVALLTGSNKMASMGPNLFLDVNSPSFPVRIFDSRSKAIEWLRGYLD